MYSQNWESHLTQRAPDGWESPRFQAGFWLQAGSGKVAFSRPAHPRVTQAVGGRTCGTENLFISMVVLRIRSVHERQGLFLAVVIFQALQLFFLVFRLAFKFGHSKFSSLLILSVWTIGNLPLQRQGWLSRSFAVGQLTFAAVHCSGFAQG
jgi:hypothetical protein